MYRGVLRPYQLEDVERLKKQSNLLLSEDMGLGKTHISMAWCEWLKENNQLLNVLIICPSSLVMQWDREIKKWTDSTTKVINGTKTVREKQWIGEKANYTIVNFEKLLRDTYPRLLVWNVIIIDEISRIRNWKTKLSKIVTKMHATQKIGLTGTPVENKPEDIYNILHWVKPWCLGNYNDFAQKYIERELVEKFHRKFWDVKGYKNLEQLRNQILPLMIRRKKQDVLKDLPPMSFETITIELSVGQRRKYNTIVHNAKQDVEEGKSSLDNITALRVLSSSPTAFNEGQASSNYGTLEDITNPKLNELWDIIQDTQEKIVVFSSFRRVIGEIEQFLKAKQKDYAIICGEETPVERDKNIEKLNNQVSILLSTDAGAYGVNLQKASILINMDLPWNPAVFNQRISRLHRIGQENKVTIITLIANNTIEEKVLGILQQKADYFDTIIEGQENVNIVNEILR